MTQPFGRRVGRLSQDAEFNACWEMLSEALTDIHHRDAGRLSFEQLYRASYKIVVRKRGGELYEKVDEFERKWFDDNVLPPIYTLASGSNLVNLVLGDVPEASGNERRDASEKFLKGMRDSWEGHTSAMSMATDVLMYLDKGSPDDDRPPIYAVVIGLYRDHILRRQFPGIDGPLTNIINAAIFDLINMERKGDVIDRNLIKRILQMYDAITETDDINDDHRLYTTRFQPSFIESSRRFYALDVQQVLAEGDVRHWLHHTDRRILEEINRCDTTVFKITQNKLVAVVEDELVTKQLERFMVQEVSGLRSMIDNNRLDDLAILYRLVSRPGVNGGVAKLQKVLSVRIIELGTEIEQGLNEVNLSSAPVAEEVANDGAEKAKPLTGSARQTAAAIKWVDDVLALKEKFDNILHTCFNDDKVLESTLTKSFSDFINIFGRCSEFVSLFIDDNLKHGIKGKTEQEIDSTLEKGITLIRYLQDKDMFQRYYQKHLARRLLHGKSESQEAEKLLITRMKQEVGSHFTQRFEGMFKDMDASLELTTKYRDYVHALGDNDRKPVSLDINVLTSNYWPQEGMYLRASRNEGAKVECIWPEEIERLQKSFLQYYLSERNGRVLFWLGSSGTADIKCTFPKVPGKETGPLSKERRYEMNVSTHGMIVLTLFNNLPEGEWLSYEDIQASTNIPSHELNRTLASLTMSTKAKVLLKEPISKSIKSTDKFTFNNSFVSKTIKIKAPVVSAQAKVEDVEERKETLEKNDEARRHIADAAIVRIMKYVPNAILTLNIYADNNHQGPQGTRAQHSHHRDHHCAHWSLQARRRLSQEAHRRPHRPLLPRACRGH